MITTENANTLINGGGNVVGQDGDKIGSIGQIYTDDQSGQPKWVTVKTGLFGSSESFVPLEDARVEGDDIVVTCDKAKVKDAPRVDADGHLSPEEEDELYRYYDLGYGTASNDYTADAGAPSAYRTADVDETAVGYDTTAGTVDRDTTRDTDDTLTRSEERLRVGTEKQEVGRARLRKYVVTENVTQTVPVSHEEVRVERIPLSGDERGTTGTIGEEEVDVTLHAERPVVAKETVPVEKVRLEKETVQDEETVTGEVRKEQIDTDTDTEGRLRDDTGGRP